MQNESMLHYILKKCSIYIHVLYNILEFCSCPLFQHVVTDDPDLTDFKNPNFVLLLIISEASQHLYPGGLHIRNPVLPVIVIKT